MNRRNQFNSWGYGSANIFYTGFPPIEIKKIIIVMKSPKSRGHWEAYEHCGTFKGSYVFI